MQRIGIQVRSWIGLTLVAAIPMGCTHFDPVTNSTLNGTGLGATTGAIIGHQSGNAGAGAIIGAAAGAIGGALVGDAHQARAERDAAYAHAQHVSQTRYEAANAVTNTDVIYMAQNDLGEAVILNAIHTRGGRFDTSPHSLINLKSAGVSDAVISAMQTSGPKLAPVAYTAPAPRPVVIVEPPPPRPIIFGRIGGYHRHCRPHRPRRSGLVIHGHF